MSDLISRQAVLDIISRSIDKKGKQVYLSDVGRAFVEISKLPGARCEHCPLTRRER